MLKWMRRSHTCLEYPSLSLKTSFSAIRKIHIGLLLNHLHSRRSLTIFLKQQGSVTSKIISYIPLTLSSRYTKALEAIKSLRKDRVSELKADKERLESLSREKAHADKLKNRIADLRSTIANKELEYEEAKKQYEALVVANQLFYDRATKFRDIYMKLETLQEQKTRYVSELEEARGVVQELEGMLDSVFVPSVF